MGRQNRSLRMGVSVAVVALMALFTWRAGGAVGGRLFHKEELRIGAFEVPRGWELAPQVAYPRVVLLALGTDGQRMTLAVQHVTLGTKADQIAADARPVLLRQGYIDPRITHESDDRVRLDATLDRGRKVLRQHYLVDGDLAFVVSVAAPPGRQVRAYRDLEEAVRSLVILPVSEVAAVPIVDGGTAD